MKLQLGAITISLAVVLSACSTPVAKESEAPDKTAYKAATTSQQSQLYNDLQNWLPGFYSNYTQVIEAGGVEDSVTDLTVSQLPTQNEPVFLFESRQRNSVDANYDLYFARLNAQSRQPELHFSRLTGSDLSKSLPETLEIGWQRVLPECVIALAPVNDQTAASVDRQLFGKSDTETCKFEDPLHGKVAFERSLSVSSNKIDMTGVELQPDEAIVESPAVLQFQQHQAYQGTVTLNTATLAAGEASPEWQVSTPFHLYDDGRVNKIYATDMQQMGYAIKLSKQHWRDNEPAYLRLEILLLNSGEAQAYSWFEADSKQIDWEMEWARVHLKAWNLNE